jgi:hypothetical protein
MISILPKLSSLPIAALYGLISVVIILCWPLYILGRHVSVFIRTRRHIVSWQSIGSRLSDPWRRWMCVSLPRAFRRMDISTYSQALAIVILFGANIVTLRLGTNSWHAMETRAGSQAMYSHDTAMYRTQLRLPGRRSAY